MILVYSLLRTRTAMPDINPMCMCSCLRDPGSTVLLNTDLLLYFRGTQRLLGLASLFGASTDLQLMLL